MKKIPLTKGKFAIVDDEDFEWLSQWKWSYKKNQCGQEYARRSSKRDAYGKVSTILMHRVILDAPDGMLVDHINHDGLNNTRKNIRICNRRQNSMNMEKSVGYSSKFKGVAWHKNNKRWVASIRINYFRKHLGSFSREEDAAEAYDSAAIKHFKEFACINFPENNGQQTFSAISRMGVTVPA